MSDTFEKAILYFAKIKDQFSKSNDPLFKGNSDEKGLIFDLELQLALAKIHIESNPPIAIAGKFIEKIFLLILNHFTINRI